MLGRVVRAVLERRGFELSRIEDGGWSTRNLHKPGVEPRVVIDVGVHQGTPELYAAFPDAYYLLVDPLAENEPHMVAALEKLKGEYVVMAAGAASGTATISVQRSQLGRSSLLERSALTQVDEALEERQIPVRTLEEIVRDRSLEGPFVIKVDTEGFELEVLRGAIKLLPECHAVIAEVSVSERFEGGYVLADMVREMSDQGFHLCDVLAVPRSKQSRNALYVDAYFRPRNATSA